VYEAGETAAPESGKAVILGGQTLIFLTDCRSQQPKMKKVLIKRKKMEFIHSVQRDEVPEIWDLNY